MYICVFEDSCSEKCNTLEEAFKSLLKIIDVDVSVCTFYEVKELKVEFSLKIV